MTISYYELTDTEKKIYSSVKREMSERLRSATDKESGSDQKYEWFSDYAGPIFENIAIDNAVDMGIKDEI